MMFFPAIAITNLGTYSSMLYDTLGVPVVDIITCAHMLQRMVKPQLFTKGETV